MEEVAVVQRLHAHIGKMLVAVQTQRRCEPGQIELEQFGCEAADFHAVRDIAWEMVAVLGAEFRGRTKTWQCLAVDLPQQQPGGDKSIFRLAFDAGPRGKNHRPLYFLRL